MSGRATNNVVAPLRPISKISIAGGAALGAAIAFIGLRALIVGGFPILFAIVLLVLGGLGMGLGWLAWNGKRAAWAVLAAMWGVLAFASFFATPKIFNLPKLEAATVEMELKLGRKAAEKKIDDENLIIRLENLAACTLFALPFGLLCAGLLTGGRDFERVTERRGE
jgi:hypothetical protein